MVFIPSISLPSNALSFAFKRRFGPSDKLRTMLNPLCQGKPGGPQDPCTSYLYNFDSNYWSTVYKHTVGKDYKFKVGYDSEVRLGWASIWVGDESGKAKTAPMKVKIQFMLQVPQDDIKSSALMFRVKKRIILVPAECVSKEVLPGLIFLGGKFSLSSLLHLERDMEARVALDGVSVMEQQYKSGRTSLGGDLLCSILS
ncbi:chloroplast outer envelope protein 37 [Actinidia rufa]|uniref:Chloroplast outer envelope protein 37 n=1 Tax=Actinidia rufa TaxID=165716 RepID=A0A7J0GIS2_9ERIC|nr:chloroplast outer envelope protein 37 [Actinidia rufa]